MRKRLRKKLKLGEFVEYGFTVEAKINGTSATGMTLNLISFRDNFLDYMERHGLGYGGVINFGQSGWMSGLRGFVIRLNGCATEEDRGVVRAYLADRYVQDRLIEDVKVGPLVDANRCSDPEVAAFGARVEAQRAYAIYRADLDVLAAMDAEADAEQTKAEHLRDENRDAWEFARES